MSKFRSAFCLAALTFMASEPLEAQPRFGWRNRAPNIFTKEFRDIHRNSTAWEHDQIRLQNYQLNRASPKERKELLRTKPGKDVQVVDLSQPQSDEIKKACTTPIQFPLTLPNIDIGNKFVEVYYDVNEHGYAVNIEIGERTRASGFSKNNAMSDMLRSSFERPAIGGQKLFCRNAYEQFYSEDSRAFQGTRVKRISMTKMLELSN